MTMRSRFFAPRVHIFPKPLKIPSFLGMAEDAEDFQRRAWSHGWPMLSQKQCMYTMYTMYT